MHQQGATNWEMGKFSSPQLSRRTRRLLLLAVAGILFVAGWFAATWLSVLRRLERVREDFTLIHRGLSEFGVDIAGIHPPDTSMRREKNPSVPLTFEWEPGYAYRVGRAKGVGSIPPSVDSPLYNCLTTPVPYVEASHLRDPFRWGATYGYASWNWQHDDLPTLAIVHSPGPDGRDDRSIVELQREVRALLVSRKAAGVDENVAPPAEALRDMVVKDLYDPTNGVRSRGDLIMFSQWSSVRFGFGAK
jgi:hypothetical protein